MSSFQQNSFPSSKSGSTSFKFPPIHSSSSKSDPFNPSDSSFCHFGISPWVDSAWLGLGTLLESPDSSKRHWCWTETQLCLFGMLLAQQTTDHVCSGAFCFPPSKQASGP